MEGRGKEGPVGTGETGEVYRDTSLGLAIVLQEGLTSPLMVVDCGTGDPYGHVWASSGYICILDLYECRANSVCMACSIWYG